MGGRVQGAEDEAVAMWTCSVVVVGRGVCVGAWCSWGALMWYAEQGACGLPWCVLWGMQMDTPDLLHAASITSLKLFLTLLLFELVQNQEINVYCQSQEDDKS